MSQPDMTTEIRHVHVASVWPVALAFGAVNGFVLAIPMIWHWIETGQWVTGYEMGVGLFSIGVLISVVMTVISVTVFAVILAAVYNLLARSVGGVTVVLSR